MLRKLGLMLLIIAVVGSVWFSAVATSHAQEPQSAGCTTLNALVPDGLPTTSIAYFYEVSDLDFLPGETIQLRTTVDSPYSTDPVPPPITNVILGVTNSTGALIDLTDQFLPGGNYTVSLDYVVVAGDDADGAFFEIGAITEVNIQSVEISCRPNNTPPVANDDGYSALEDATVRVANPGILGNDSDGDSEPLTAVLVSGPSNGSLTLNADGSFTYTPVANFTGIDSFTYLANDGRADSNVATVSITVSAGSQSDGCTTLNTVIANPQTDPFEYNFVVSGLEFFPGETIHLNTTVSSPPPENIAVWLYINSSGGNLAANEDFYPSGQFSISLDYVVVAGDNADGVHINIFGFPGYEILSLYTSCTPSTNTAPVANDDSYSTNEDTPLSVAAPGVLGNDSDGESDPLTAVLVSGPSNGSLTLNADGSFSYMPNANFSGADSFTYLANDGQADSNVATVSITVVSATDQITQLATDVQALIDSGVLSQADANKLFHALDQAQKHLDKGQMQPTSNILEKFVKGVNKLIDKGDLSGAQGQPLIDATNAIINSLN